MPHCSDCGAAVDATDAYCAGCGLHLDDSSTTARDHQGATAAESGDSQAPVSAGRGRADARQRGGLPTPDSLKVACAGLAVLGVLSAVGGVSAIRAQQALGSMGGGFGGPYGAGGGMEVGLLVTGALLLALGAGYLVAAYGLWNATGWAWTVTLVTTGVGTALYLVAPAGGGGGVLAAFASGGLCAYLALAGDECRPSVRWSMARRRREPTADDERSAEGF